MNACCGITQGSMRGTVLPLLILALVPSTSRATRPVDPLPAGYYSFDLASTNGLVQADDVLVHPGPTVVYPGVGLGLGRPGDELDALSSANTELIGPVEFAVLFSVDRDTIGLAPPDPFLVGNGVPYNAMDQAWRGHAAGDQYMSLLLFARWGIIGPPLRQSYQPGNTLTRNNFNEGGTGFDGRPAASAERMTAPAGQDSVDAMSLPSGRSALRDDPLYFSVSSASPSLLFLNTNGSASGADVFHDPDPLVGGNERLYATAGDLDLQTGDDIDALLVIDEDGNGEFDGGDQVIFSLASGSPSLTLIPGASPDGAAADVYVVTVGVVPQLFASAFDLGLGAPDDIDRTDNVDALSFTPCADALFCALQHGIRAPLLGDHDHDGDVDLDDYAAFPDCLTGPQEAPAYVPPSLECQEAFDGDADTDVDLSDFDEFQIQFGHAL